MGHHHLLFPTSLIVSVCAGGIGGLGNGDVLKVDLDMLNAIFGTDYSEYETNLPLQTRQDEGKQDCASFSASLGLRCVPYHDCDEGGRIINSYYDMIDVRIDVSDAEEDFTNYYCPGKFEICCQDPDFVEEKDVSVHEANIHSLHETNKTVGKDNESKEEQGTKACSYFTISSQLRCVDSDICGYADRRTHMWVEKEGDVGLYCPGNHQVCCYHPGAEPTSSETTTPFTTSVPTMTTTQFTSSGTTQFTSFAPTETSTPLTTIATTVESTTSSKSTSTTTIKTTTTSSIFEKREG